MHSHDGCGCSVQRCGWQFKHSVFPCAAAAVACAWLGASHALPSASHLQTCMLGCQALMPHRARPVLHPRNPAPDFTVAAGASCPWACGASAGAGHVDGPDDDIVAGVEAHLAERARAVVVLRKRGSAHSQLSDQSVAADRWSSESQQSQRQTSSAAVLTCNVMPNMDAEDPP